MPIGRAGQAYFDLRCLQDVNYQFRGIGYHVAALLRRADPARDFDLIGLTDPDLPPLPECCASLVDRVSMCWNPSISEDILFVSTSPMTHDPELAIRFVSHPRCLSAAIIYDFIPFDREGYLPAISDRIDYFAKLAFLRNIDLFLPISAYSAKRLCDITGVDPRNIAVTGASVRASLCAESGRITTSGNGRSSVHEPRYFLTVGGGDRRKNTEAAVKALWSLRLLCDEPVRLKIVGHYPPDYKADLISLATQGGSENFVEFHEGISDAQLVSLYWGAVATIAPSHIEGFSLPVVEAAACGSPVIASTCAAHLELLGNPEALFPSTDTDALCGRLRQVLAGSELRTKLLDEQSALATTYREDRVAGRFWEFLGRHEKPSAPYVHRHIQPRVAFLTPYPPQHTGVAAFSENTLAAAAKYMDLDLYTDAPRPLLMPEGVSDAGHVHNAVLRRGPYDSIISVLGNSDTHNPMFELVEKFGGPCILHDSRLIQIYHWRMGRERFLPWAEKLIGRSPSGPELDLWLHDQDPPSLFIEPILERAEPLIVHNERSRDIIRERYGYEAAVTTFPPNLQLSEEELSPESRSSARRRLGIPSNIFAVGSFGFVSAGKGVTELIIAIEMLRSWNIPAELYLIGSDEYSREQVRSVAWMFGVSEFVHSNPEYVAPGRYRDYMLGMDAAVQLRSYDFGQLSAALADCISAGLSCVSNESLGQACGAPGYVTRVPNHLSPLLVAEALAHFHEHPRETDAMRLEQRRQYLATHNFDVYARRLTQILGFA